MRVVLIPQGTHGDARPLVALGLALRDAGHEPLFAASPDHRTWIEGLGFAFHAVGNFMERPSDEADRSVGRPFRMLWSGVKFVMELVPRQFADLEPLLDGADLVVGSGLEFAGRTLAERRGIPYRFVCHVPTAVPSRYHPPVAIPFRSFPIWVNRLLWWSNGIGTRLTFGRDIQRQRRRFELAPVSDLARFLSSDLVLAADEALAPLPADCRVRFRTGYFAFDDPQPMSADLAAFLDAGPTPVYIGFGSMADPRPARTIRILEELSLEHRLIVFNRRARRLCPANMPNIHWVDGVSHHQLFRRVAAVVHHGGAGTTHTAARVGVPQIVVPHLIDQYYWAERVRQLGIGPSSLKLGGLSARALGAALGQVMPGSPIQRRSAALAQELDGAARCAVSEMVHHLEHAVCGRASRRGELDRSAGN